MAKLTISVMAGQESNKTFSNLAFDEEITGVGGSLWVVYTCNLLYFRLLIQISCFNSLSSSTGWGEEANLTEPKIKLVNSLV